MKRLCAVPLLAALALLDVPVAAAATQESSSASWLSVTGAPNATGGTYVLVTGVVGGIAGYHQLQARLTALGARVVAIDPYQLSLDSADVSFNALAQRVNAQLDQLGVHSATLVGHAHGGGVALRVAADVPARVGRLVLLNVGALDGNRSPAFSMAVRLAPLVTRLPGGRKFVRGRIVAGLRKASGSDAWLTDSTVRAYTNFPLDNIGRSVGMAKRLSASREPEPLEAVLARVRAPVLVLRGALTCSASPVPEELSALATLGPSVRVEAIARTCHFPHEEAPSEVVRWLTLAPR